MTKPPDVFEESHERGYARYERMGWSGSQWWDVEVHPNGVPGSDGGVEGFSLLRDARKFALEALGPRMVKR